MPEARTQPWEWADKWQWWSFATAHHPERSPREEIENSMPTFVVEYTYSPESSSGRDDHRTDHHAWLAELVRRKVVLSSSPVADHSGFQFIVDAADADTVARLFGHDPFAQAHLVSHVSISPWNR